MYGRVENARRQRSIRLLMRRLLATYPARDAVSSLEWGEEDAILRSHGHLQRCHPGMASLSSIHVMLLLFPWLPFVLLLLIESFCGTGTLHLLYSSSSSSFKHRVGRSQAAGTAGAGPALRDICKRRKPVYAQRSVPSQADGRPLASLQDSAGRGLSALLRLPSHRAPMT